jgi:peptide/nickel transport system substrate-binding protein
MGHDTTKQNTWQQARTGASLNARADLRHRYGEAWRRMTFILALAAPMFVTPGATGATATDNPVHGGTLVAIVQPEPGVLTSNLDVGEAVSTVSSKIFDGLVKLGPEFKLEPDLATSWSVSPDGKTIVFNLRHGVKWQDGQPLTSADVQYSLQEIWRKFQPRLRSALANVQDVQTPDPYTVVLKLSRPAPVILLALNSSQAQVLPRHLYAGTDIIRNPYNVKPIGTGPFRFKEWVRGDRIVLERNPDYWDAGKPYLDRVVYRIIPDAAARSAAFERGDVQYGSVFPVAPSDLTRVAALPGIKVTHTGYAAWGTTLSLEFNLRNPALRDIRVRRAIAHAIDRQKLIDVASHGLGKVSTGPVPSSLTQFYTADTPQYPYDIDAANHLLDQAGFPRKADGTRLSLYLDWIPFSEDQQHVAEFIRQSLKRVGIDIRIRNQDLPRFFQRLYTDRDFDLATVPMSASGDPQIGLERYFSSAGILRGVPFSNATGYQNPQLDAIFESAHVETDPAKREELYRQFQRIVQTDLPSYAILEASFSTVYADTVHGLSDAPDGAIESFSGVWLKTPQETHGNAPHP